MGAVYRSTVDAYLPRAANESGLFRSAKCDERTFGRFVPRLCMAQPADRRPLREEAELPELVILREVEAMNTHLIPSFLNRSFKASSV